MRELAWRKGPPPHVGWWNASMHRYRFMWRWWDGEKWSDAASDERDSGFAAGSAQCFSDILMDSYRIGGIEWTTYWPENARVPRINPVTGEVTSKGPDEKRQEAEEISRYWQSLRVIGSKGLKHKAEQEALSAELLGSLKELRACISETRGTEAANAVARADAVIAKVSPV